VHGEFSVSYVSAVERGQIRPSLVALEHLSPMMAPSFLARDLAGILWPHEPWGVRAGSGDYVPAPA
jgi:hypothetical protein